MGQLNQAIDIKNVLDFYDIDNFIETGTGQAEVVQTVVEIDESLNVHTIEVVEQIYDKNKINFSYMTNVTWHLGRSFDLLPEILSGLEGNTLFYESGIIIPEIKYLNLNSFDKINLFFGGVNGVSLSEAIGDKRRGGHGIIN